MFALAALALFLEAPVSQLPEPAALAFDISGRNYVMPIPSGYCVPQQLPVGARGDQSSAAGIIVANLAYIQNCQTANEGGGNLRFIHLKYLKNFNPGAPSRGAYLASAAKQMGSTTYVGEQESEAFADRVESRMEDATGKKIDAQISAVHLGRDDLCVYQARTMKIALAGDAVGALRMVSCTTWINGRVASIDIGSPSDGGLGFGAMLRELRAVAASIAPSK